MAKHIILIGFKCVGKTAIGHELARAINCPFIDLDEEIVKAYFTKYHQQATCRQIMLSHGQEAFRKIEHDALSEVVKLSRPGVISLGGGAVMYEPSHELIVPHTVVWVTAPKNIVFERIMVRGRPAFFSPQEHPLESFKRFWALREPVYARLAKYKIDNAGTLEQAVEKIKCLIKR